MRIMEHNEMDSRARPVDVTTWQPPLYAAQVHAYFAGEPLRLGAGTHLLAHSALIEDRCGVERRLTLPVRQAEPVLAPEHPWEHRRAFYPTILADPATGRLRMWYGTLPAFKPGEPIPPYSLLYAESDDGMHWEKPLLEIVPDSDHAHTNIVYRGANHNCSAVCIVVDPNETDPARRYKMLHKGGADANGVLGEELAFSPDGLHWQPYAGNPVMPMRHDCNLNLLYDPQRNVWRAYCRPYAWASGRWLPGDHPRRRIAIAESPDLIRWGKVRTAIAPQEGDANEFDHIAVFPCGNLLVGMLGIFDVPDDDQHTQLMHIELAFSLDGLQWERLPGRPKFLSPSGVDTAFDRDSVQACSAAVRDPKSGEMLFYYNGSVCEQQSYSTAIGILRMKPDRFVEQASGPEGGWLLTREFMLEGDALTVNCRAQGAVRVELAEYPGQPIPGFSADECDPIRGDHLAHRVTWRGGDGDLAELRGKPVYLRFKLEDAGIWAFEMEARA